MLPDGTYIRDSKAIAPIIEAKYPSPPLRLDSPLKERMMSLVIKFVTELQPVYVTQAPKKYLSDASIPFFKETRARDFGKPLEQIEAENPRDVAFAKAAPAFHEFTALLAEAGGPFLEGKEVIYLDLVWAGFLLFFKGMGDEIYEPFLEASGDRKVHERFLDAMSPWTQRNDH